MHALDSRYRLNDRPDRSRRAPHLHRDHALPVHARQLFIQHDAAPRDDDHSPADRLNFRQDVRGKKDRVLLRQLANHVAHLQDLDRIQSRCRLVEYQDRRIVQHRVGQPDPLAKPARKLTDDPPLNLRKLTPAHNLGNRHPPLLPRHVFQLRAITQKLVDPHIGVQRHVLRQIPHAAPNADRLVKHIVSGQRGPPARRTQIRRQHSHRRRLARSVGPEQTDDLAWSDIKTNTIDRFERAKPLRQPIHVYHDDRPAPRSRIRLTSGQTPRQRMPPAL